MTLLCCEWRKLFRLPALWVFLGLSLLFNGFLMVGQWHTRQPFNAISADAALLGQRVDSDFREKLSALPETEVREAVLRATEDYTDIFETYDTQRLTAYYRGMVPNLSPWMAEGLEWKYAQLQKRVDHLAQTDAALDLCAGPLTNTNCGFLFETLMLAMLAEAGLLALLVPLLLIYSEQQHGTTALVCASRMGRRLWEKKLLAALSASLLLYGAIVLATLVPYFLLWDYTGIWEASISSQFHTMTEMLLKRPFMTWADFTVGEYLGAVLLLGGGLTLVFCLLGSVCGLLLQNSYMAGLLELVVLFAPLAGISLCTSAGLWTLVMLLCVAPIRLWMVASGWFTELGLNAVLPWQETAGVALHLLLLGGLAILALMRFYRKDVCT